MSAVSRKAAPHAKPYELRLVIFLLALLAARLIANALARTDLVVDEAQYWSWSRELDFGYFSKPPLLAWLIRGTTQLCGNGEACVRSFPPLLSAIATWFVFLTGRALYGARAGFWSAIVFDTLPVIAFLAAAITTDAWESPRQTRAANAVASSALTRWLSSSRSEGFLAWQSGCEFDWPSHS